MKDSKSNFAQQNKYIVYKHISPSGKVYIGITRQKVTKRWQAGGGYSYNIHFINAIKKYGWNNFVHEILYEGLSETEAKEKEIEMISFYDSTNRNKGYNVSPGGATNSTETIKKIQATREKNGINEKERNRMLSVWSNPQKRQQIIESMQNKPRTEEQKEHYRASNARKGKPLPNETKAKLSEIASKKTGELSARAKPVCQIEPINGTVVHIYPTAREAAIAIGDKSISAISNLCRKENQSKQFKHGFYWCYEYDLDTFLKNIELNPEITPSGKIRKKPEENSQYRKKLSEKQKERISLAHRKKVQCIDTGKIYSSLREAASNVGIKSPELISRQIRGKIKTAGGYMWKYVE